MWLYFFSFFFFYYAGPYLVVNTLYLVVNSVRDYRLTYTVGFGYTVDPVYYLPGIINNMFPHTTCLA